jgi:hypothetical protein
VASQVYVLGGGLTSLFGAVVWPIAFTSNGITVFTRSVTRKVTTTMVLLVVSKGLDAVLPAWACWLLDTLESETEEWGDHAACWSMYGPRYPGFWAGLWALKGVIAWGLLLMIAPVLDRVAARMEREEQQKKQQQERGQGNQQQQQQQGRGGGGTGGQQPSSQSSKFPHGFGSCPLVPGCTGQVKEVLQAKDYYQVRWAKGWIGWGVWRWLFRAKFDWQFGLGQAEMVSCFVYQGAGQDMVTGMSEHQAPGMHAFHSSLTTACAAAAAVIPGLFVVALRCWRWRRRPRRCKSGWRATGGCCMSTPTKRPALGATRPLCG